jgi:pimeloyl-ACP methyl ester carboxylesterase
MGTYMQIGGHPTWVEDRGGEREPLLLLHGGFSNSDRFLEGVGRGLTDWYRVVAFDRRGHGYTADTDADFHYADMATETIRVLQDVVGGPAHLVGWSDGGIVALLVAVARPDLVRKMVVIGSNYHADGVIPVLEQGEGGEPAGFRNALVGDYAERSPDGAEHFEVVFGKGLAMATSEPSMTTAELARISAPCLVMAGDDDMVLLPHTCSLFEALPRGQLAVVPATSHALPLEKPGVVVELVVDFLTAEEPPRTLLPIRRARPVSA